MANFTPSKYQQAVYDFIATGNGNAVIDAVAGSGKSTTIINGLKQIDESKSVLFLAFNKSIVEELKIKVSMQENVEVMTLHSLGAKALMRTFKCKVDANKYRAHFNQGLEFGAYKPHRELEYEELAEYKQNVMKLVDLIRVNLCNSTSQFFDLAMKHNIDLISNECEVAGNVIRWGYNKMDVIDFTDMIYFPVVKNIKLEKYDWVFIDECQDLNAAQRQLFLKCLKDETGRFVAVGDPRQAIYGFAGADVESFNLLQTLPNTVSLPLSVCYRCDGEIVELAKKLVPQIEARENAPKGKVDNNASIKNIKDNDMVVCRFTAPLTQLCMQYISEGVKAYIMGKDIGVNLVNMIKKTNRTRMDDVFKIFNKELSKIEIRISEALKCSLGEARQYNQYTNYEDKVAAINVLAEGLTTANQVIKRIEAIFSDDNRQGICLSTIHKSKGLEADNVYILCPEEMHSKRAMQIDWMAQQEYNLEYVAYTRAKHYLGFITDFIKR